VTAAETRVAVQASATLELSRNKYTLFISQFRLSPIQRCDELLVAGGQSPLCVARRGHTNSRKKQHGTSAAVHSPYSPTTILLSPPQAREDINTLMVTYQVIAGNHRVRDLTRRVTICRTATNVTIWFLAARGMPLKTIRTTLQAWLLACVGHDPVVRTTRNRALPLIMRS
jgi:hypothetical protein